MNKPNTKYPPVVVVDENDNETGSAMLAEVWEKGLYHRIVVIFVFDDYGRMLLQLRSPHVGVNPNLWDQAVGGHVDDGYTYDQAAALEVEEEIGLANVPLTTVGTHRSSRRDGDRTFNQFVRVYSARIPHDAKLQPQPEEVSKLQWFTPAEFKAEITRHPEAFTPNLYHEIEMYFPDFLM